MDSYNGGAVIKVGAYLIPKLSGYTYRFVPLEKRFETYDFKTVSQFSGYQYTATVTCGLMNDSERTLLEAELQKHEFYFESDEFQGDVMIDSYQQNLVHANVYGKHYRPSFTVTAVAPINSSGGL